MNCITQHYPCYFRDFYHMLEMRLKSSVRDTPIEHSNILAIDLMSDAETPRRPRRKKTISRLVYLTAL